ncbi:DUF5050 domain-containing protein [Lachnoclostridium phytofermentans]|uniref:DUF5050 domain-containing protein n=1 Tax=Lachnoclostridium phytofermentans TaxID=66219 RepID=UPI000495E2EF|nr:DUF5050 domain-containing protein [Lachnoclostridium phytofermentans]
MQKKAILIIIICLFLLGCTQRNQKDIDTLKEITVTPTVIAESITPTKTDELLIPTEILVKVPTTPTPNITEEVFSHTLLGITPENSCNNGIIVSEGDYVYFWSGYYYSEEGKFCRMKQDGTELQILSDDKPCFINIINGKLYYISQKERTYYRGDLYSMDFNGENRKLIVEGECDYLIVMQNSIYYVDASNDMTLYETDLEGKGGEIIKKGCSDVQYQDGYFYYRSTESINDIYMFPIHNATDTTRLITTSATDFISKFIVYNNFIIFIKNNILYSYSITENSVSKLHNGVSSYGMTIKEDKIYLLSFYEEEVLGQGIFMYDIVCYDLKEKNLRLVAPYKDGDYMENPLYVINDYIYFGVADAEGSVLENHRSKLDESDEECLLHDKILGTKAEGDCLIR